MKQNITGVLTAVVTTFDAQGAFHPAAQRQQVRRQLSAGNGILRRHQRRIFRAERAGEAGGNGNLR